MVFDSVSCDHLICGTLRSIRLFCSSLRLHSTPDWYRFLWQLRSTRLRRTYRRTSRREHQLSLGLTVPSNAILGLHAEDATRESQLNSSNRNLRTPEAPTLALWAHFRNIDLVSELVSVNLFEMLRETFTLWASRTHVVGNLVILIFTLTKILS